ncbi:MAG: hypothetical protein AAF515_06280 [Pseudomonadota bacterium]
MLRAWLRITRAEAYRRLLALVVLALDEPLAISRDIALRALANRRLDAARRRERIDQVPIEYRLAPGGRTALAQPQGLVLLLPRMQGHARTVAALCRQFAAARPVHVLVDPQQRVDLWRDELRDSGADLHLSVAAPIRSLRRALSAGAVLLSFIDMPVDDAPALPTRWFDLPVRVHAMAIRLARQTRSGVLPVAPQALPDRLLVDIGPALPRAADGDTATAVLARLERCVRAAPELWLAWPALAGLLDNTRLTAAPEGAPPELLARLDRARRAPAFAGASRRRGLWST